MIASSTMRWVLLALAGLLVAVAVAVLAGKLTSQRIGLASEPLRAGEALAPRPATGPGSRGTSGERGGPSTTSTDRTSTATTTPTTSTTTSTTPTTTTTTPDDSQSGGERDGEGSSGDD